MESNPKSKGRLVLAFFSNTRTPKYFHVPATPHQIREFHFLHVQLGKTPTEETFCKGGKPFNQKEFKAFRRYLMSTIWNGQFLALWKYPGHRRGGWYLSRMGKRAVRLWASHDKVAPPPLAKFAQKVRKIASTSTSTR